MHVFADVDGIFRSRPIEKLAAGTLVDVIKLVLEDCIWEPALDQE